MKTIQKVLSSLVVALLVSLSSFAQEGAKVIGVINHADWCGACKKNGERAKAAFEANNKDGAFQFVVNNVTNKTTKNESEVVLDKLGLKAAMSSNRGTGVVYFFDAKSKTYIV